MCGIAGIVDLRGRSVPHLRRKLALMNDLIAHRGPDGTGVWENETASAGLAHQRLTIIDLSEAANQPMVGENGACVSFNGEIYNYRELREALSGRWRFRTSSDTEAILAAQAAYGDAFLEHLRGMFAFALWDEQAQRLLLARDRIGIKPLYYAQVGGALYFASEAKALLPFLPEIETDADALSEYFTFQYVIGEHTLFKGVRQLLPGHALSLDKGELKTWRYWDVAYEIDWDHSHGYFYRRLQELMADSIGMHLRADVPVGGYMSGGMDSTLISMLAAGASDAHGEFFHGKFTDVPGYDESAYAEAATRAAKGRLHQIEIGQDDFRNEIEKVIYHLDYPVAGPGSFPQYMVSKLAAEQVKVVLGGQGGDEIFGGYARYLLAYFEQCIKAAIDGTYRDGNYVVTIESIIPNLGVLREYKPMIRNFWKDGLFEDLDARYFRLINRATDMEEEIDHAVLDRARVFERFRGIFNNTANVGKEAYFDKMTHFDFKCLLPALLHVEDRMSMAHGLEARVPLLDHPLIEFLATVPADVKFKDGHMKHMLKSVYSGMLPQPIIDRRDKMGFPVPLQEWYTGGLRDFVLDMFSSQAARSRPYLSEGKPARSFMSEAPFSRKSWALLSLELWQQQFHDRASEWQAMGTQGGAPATTGAAV